jgi:cell wall-associated NlpC family hydrolase
LTLCGAVVASAVIAAPAVAAQAAAARALATPAAYAARASVTPIGAAPRAITHPAAGVAPVAPPAIAKRRPTTTTARPSRTTLVAGESVKLVGRTTFGAGQTRVRWHTLRLQAKSGSGWNTIGSKHLSREGYVSYTVRPGRSTTYRLLYRGQGTLASSASAATVITVRARTTSTASGATAASAKVARVLAVAAAQAGKSYRFGASGPTSFDCSGLTQYVYRHVGVTLPHKANLQKAFGRPVSRAAARPGDLVVFVSGGYGYHVGIYAGNGYMYDAPRPGQLVGKRKIWSSNVVFRRLL